MTKRRIIRTPRSKAAALAKAIYDEEMLASLFIKQTKAKEHQDAKDQAAAELEARRWKKERNDWVHYTRYCNTTGGFINRWTKRFECVRCEEEFTLDVSPVRRAEIERNALTGLGRPRARRERFMCTNCAGEGYRVETTLSGPDRDELDLSNEDF